MRVTVRYYGIVADVARRKVEGVELADGASVGELLDRLSAADPRIAAVASQLQVVVNGVNAGLGTPLGADADVVFMRAVGGGSPRRCGFG
ncbi:MAG: MoaD/ThiS family protein [Thermomicrobiales bacterium]